MQVFANNAASTLASSITSGDTSLPFAAGTGALFPDVSATGNIAYLTLEKADGSAREIVKLVARSTDTGTMVRGQEGTTAIAFSGGDKISLRHTAAGILSSARRLFLDRMPAWIVPSTSTTVPPAFNMLLSAAVGTFSTYVASDNGTIADEHKGQIITSSGTTNSNGCGLTSANEKFFSRGAAAQHGGFLMALRFVPPTLVAGNRLFVGFNQSSTLAPVGGAVETSATGTDMIGIGSDSGDTDISIFTRDNVTTTKTALSTPVSKVNMSGRMYDIEIECAPGVVTTMRVKVVEWNGDTRAVLHDGVVSTTLPRVNIGMRWHWGMGQGSDAVSARTLRFLKAYLEHSSSPSF